MEDSFGLPQAYAGVPCVFDPSSTPALAVSTVSAPQEHLLSRNPSFVYTYMECLIAEANFVVGDRLYEGYNKDGGNAGGWIVQTDDTNTWIITNGIMKAYNKTNGGSTTLTAANWRIVAIPYSFRQPTIGNY